MTEEPRSLDGVQACVFDAYGTLFDFASAAARCSDVPEDRRAALTDPSSAGTEVPSTRAWPPETSAGTLLFSPTNSATNGVAGFA